MPSRVPYGWRFNTYKKSIELVLFVLHSLGIAKRLPQVKLNFEPYPMLRYAVALRPIHRQKQKASVSFVLVLKFWRTLMSGPIQMLSSHRTTSRVDFRVQRYAFFQYQCLKRIRFSTKMQKINKIKIFFLTKKIYKSSIMIHKYHYFC